MDINVYLELIWLKLVFLFVVFGVLFWVFVVVCLFVDNCYFFFCCGFVVFVVLVKIVLFSFFLLMFFYEVLVKMIRKID